MKKERVITIACLLHLSLNGTPSSVLPSYTYRYGALFLLIVPLVPTCLAGFKSTCWDKEKHTALIRYVERINRALYWFLLPCTHVTEEDRYSPTSNSGSGPPSPYILRRVLDAKLGISSFELGFCCESCPHEKDEWMDQPPTNERKVSTSPRWWRSAWSLSLAPIRFLVGSIMLNRGLYTTWHTWIVGTGNMFAYNRLK